MLRIKSLNIATALNLRRRPPFQLSGKILTDGLGQQLGHEAKSNFRVCVICYTPYSYPVTFIRAHIQLLPARVVVLYGGYFRTAAI